MICFSERILLTGCIRNIAYRADKRMEDEWLQ